MTYRQRQRIRNRTYRRDCLSEGRCPCGLRLNDASKWACEYCCEARRQYQRQARALKRDLGLCEACGEPSERSRYHCFVCREKKNQRQRDCYALKAAA